jgi:uridine phosphorylase
METAALYALSRLLDHEAISVNVILANRTAKTFLHQFETALDSLIEKVLERI